jgi:gamma-glutamylcyclotransferase (GGCT)/AIG2-like uncharacterized protein YtfP
MDTGDFIVFYGSLRVPYETRARIGIDAMVEHVGGARFAGSLHDLGRYPAVVGGPQEVVGDLYRVIDDRLAGVLDPFEGFDPHDPAGSHYLRERIRLIDPEVSAWIYRFCGVPPAGSLVAGGDWVTHLAGRGRSGTLGPDAGP